MIWSTEDVGQLELVIDLSEPNLCAPQVDDEIYSVIIEISGVYLQGRDDACHVESPKRSEMKPFSSPLNKQPCTWRDTSSISLEKKSASTILNIQVAEGCEKGVKGEGKDEGSPTGQIVEKQGIHSRKMVEDTRKDLEKGSGTLPRLNKNVPVLRHQKEMYRSREGGWNQYCTGANVPLSFKRTRCSLLGRYKSNPVLEDVAPNITTADKIYKIE